MLQISFQIFLRRYMTFSPWNLCSWNNIKFALDSNHWRCNPSLTTLFLILVPHTLYVRICNFMAHFLKVEVLVPWPFHIVYPWYFFWTHLDHKGIIELWFHCLKLITLAPLHACFSLMHVFFSFFCKGCCCQIFFTSNLICDYLSILKLMLFFPLRYLKEYVLLKGWNERMVPLPQQQQLI